MCRIQKRVKQICWGPALGWIDFLDTCHVVLNCCETPNPKFQYEMLLFHLAQCLRVTLKSAHTKMLFEIFKDCAKNKFCSLVCLKAQNDEKLNKFSFFFFWAGQKPFCPFWGPKIKFKLKLFPKFSPGRLFLEVKGNYLQIEIFNNKNFLWFFEN